MLGKRKYMTGLERSMDTFTKTSKELRAAALPLTTAGKFRYDIASYSLMTTP